MVETLTRSEAKGGAETTGRAVDGYVVSLVAGGFLAFSGAFGSDTAPLFKRLLYWVPLMLLGGAWGTFCAARVVRVEPCDGRPLLRGALLTLVIGVPFSLVVWFATSVFFGFPLRLDTLPFTLVNVLIVAAIVTAINVVLRRRPATVRAAPSPGEPPRFLQRLPLKLRGAEIHAVEAEDHYLRVHTDRGSDLILMRLTDAVTELDGLEGAQTHRSWWVARAAVVDAERGDGRAVLTLKSGVRVPVSRTYAKPLRDAGWW